jgi:capsular polysaccharide biosynthesis protein
MKESSMNPLSDESSLGIERYGWVLRRQWKIIVACAVLGLLAGAAILNVRPPLSTATTDVSINVISTAPFDASNQSTNLLDATTESQIATSYAVAKRASLLLDGQFPATTVRAATTVDAVTDKDVVHVMYTASTAALARRGANAVAAAYLDYRSQQAVTTQRAILAGNQSRLDALKKQLDAANGQIASAVPGSSAANRAKSSHDLLITELTSIVTQQTVLQQIDTSGGSVLTSATNNPVTVGPNPLVILLAGLLAGAVLGVIIAFPVNARQRRWRTAREAQRSTRAPVLGSVVAKEARIPETGETLEVLRSARELLFSELAPEAQVLAIVDDTAGKEPSDIPVNFALAIAESGRVVELVLPGITADRALRLSADLELVELKSDEDGTVSMSNLAHSLRVYFPAVGKATGELVSAAVQTRVGSSRSNLLYVLALPARASRSSTLTAIRASDAVVLVAALRSSNSRDVDALLADVETLDKKFVGTITVLKKRHMGPRRVVEPEPWIDPASNESRTAMPSKESQSVAAAAAAAE